MLLLNETMTKTQGLVVLNLGFVDRKYTSMFQPSPKVQQSFSQLYKFLIHIDEAKGWWNSEVFLPPTPKTCLNLITYHSVKKRLQQSLGLGDSKTSTTASNFWVTFKPT